jgi:hypothetical protein
MNVTAGNPYAWSLISESGFEIEVAPREFDRISSLILKI